MRSSQSEKRADNRQGIQLEEGVGDLKHEDMRMTVVMNYKDALDCTAHAKVLIVVLETLQTSRDGRVFLRLCLFGTVN